MRTLEPIQVEHFKIKEIVCNKCEKIIKPIQGWEGQEMHHFFIEGQYGSIFDGHIIEFDLCDDCLEEIMNTFKIQHEMRDCWPGVD